MKKIALLSILLTACQINSEMPSTSPSGPVDVFEKKYSYKVEVIAGAQEPGFKDGVGEAAALGATGQFRVSSKGNIFLNDSVNFAIRKIDTQRKVTTLKVFEKQEGWQTFHINNIAINDEEDIFYLDHIKKCWMKLSTSAQDEAIFCADDSQDTRYAGQLYFREHQMYVAGGSEGDYLIDKDKNLMLVPKGPSPQLTNSDGDSFYISQKVNVVKVFKEGGRKEIGMSFVPNNHEDATCHGSPFEVPEECPVYGDVDGPPETAQFNRPIDLVVAQNDYVYVSQRGRHLRVIYPNLYVGTVPLNLKRGVGKMFVSQDGAIIASSDSQLLKITIQE